MSVLSAALLPAHRTAFSISRFKYLLNESIFSSLQLPSLTQSVCLFTSLVVINNSGCKNVWPDLFITFFETCFRKLVRNLFWIPVLSCWDLVTEVNLPAIVVQLLSPVWLLATHGLQHARLPCPSSFPGAWSESCPLGWKCHPTISSSVIPFSSCLQSFLASGSFLMSQLFSSGGQSIGASASASVLPMNIQDWFSIGWTGLSLCCPMDPQESSSTPQFKNINYLVLSFRYGPTLTSIHDYWKNHNFDYMDLLFRTPFFSLIEQVWKSSSGPRGGLL